MLDVIIKNSVLVELQMPSTAPTAGQRFYFRDVPLLRDKLVYAIIAHASGVDYTTSTQGQAVIDVTEARVSLLTLSDPNGNLPVYQLPVYQLIATNNGGLIRTFSNIPIDIQQSYVEINESAVLEANDTFAFTFIFQEPVKK